MAISIEVKPDFSAFRTPTVQEIVDEIGCDEVTAQALLDRYLVLPR